MDKPVRVRFAPSPTGGLHIGGVRTALYNYLFAKQSGGKFIIRIEDTDQTRFVEGAEEYIYKSLEWLGIQPDESTKVGGDFGPYRQSERKELYHKYAMQLVEGGHAYYAFDTTEELDEMKKKLVAAKSKNANYNAISRQQMKNSLTLPAEEVKAKLDNGDPYVIRLKIPHKEEIRFNDLVRGWVMVHSSVIDDKVLMKSDGMPTYHLANIVDDHLMEISHVIRGEEWLPSAPLHILLYKSFGWEPPIFAHLPLILRPDGKGKLSKRVADELGFPIFPLTWTDPKTDNVSKGYKENGFLPETIINFLVLLGWSPSDNEEFFTLAQLEEIFSVKRIGKSGMKFDIKKATWFNEQYLKGKSAEELKTYLQNGLDKAEVDCSKYDEKQLSQICEMMKERISFPDDIWKEALFLFEPVKEYDQKTIDKKWKSEAVDCLKAFATDIDAVDTFDAGTSKDQLKKSIEAKEMKLGQVMPCLRLALTGSKAGPDLGEIMDVLGKEEVKKRLQIAFDTLSA